jgi:hypothetical protein
MSFCQSGHYVANDRNWLAAKAEGNFVQTAVGISAYQGVEMADFCDHLTLS